VKPIIRPFRQEDLWEFVNTHLTLEQRRIYNVSDEAWNPHTARCEQLQRTLIEILRDWGAFLELSLYLDALTWFFGGEPAVIREVALVHEGIHLGHQRLHLALDKPSSIPNPPFDTTASLEFVAVWQEYGKPTGLFLCLVHWSDGF
jgi:hypothetical protein